MTTKNFTMPFSGYCHPINFNSKKISSTKYKYRACDLRLHGILSQSNIVDTSQRAARSAKGIQ